MLRQRRWAEVGLPATPAARREASSPPETADVRRSTTVGWVEQREIHHRNCFGYCYALTSLVAVPTRGMVDKLRVVHPTRRGYLRREDDAFFIHRGARLSGLLALPSTARLSMPRGQNALSVVFSRQSRQFRPCQTHSQILLTALWITFAKALRA